MEGEIAAVEYQRIKGLDSVSSISSGTIIHKDKGISDKAKLHVRNLVNELLQREDQRIDSCFTLPFNVQYPNFNDLCQVYTPKSMFSKADQKQRMVVDRTIRVRKIVKKIKKASEEHKKKIESGDVAYSTRLDPMSNVFKAAKEELDKKIAASRRSMRALASQRTDGNTSTHLASPYASQPSSTFAID